MSRLRLPIDSSLLPPAVREGWQVTWHCGQRDKRKLHSALLVAGLLVTLPLLSGCATQFVRGIGLRESEIRGLSATEMIMASDWSVALKCENDYYRASYGPLEPLPSNEIVASGRTIANRKCYVLIQSDAVKAAITNYTREKWDNRDTCVIDFHPGVTVVPSGFLAGDATDDMLPAKFRENPPYSMKVDKDAQYIDFPVCVWRGTKYRLRMDRYHVLSKRVRRRWWGYPAQIMLVPAVLIDAPIVVVGGVTAGTVYLLWSASGAHWD